MSTLTIDGYTISGEPLIISALFDTATHLIDRMMEEGSERTTLPFVFDSNGHRVATRILLRRSSTVVATVDDNGDEIGAQFISRTDADWNALVRSIKARADEFDGQ